MIVVDESTKFKNWTCKRMKAMRKMLPDFRKRLILTGTPAPNSLADLHGQAYIIDDGVALGRNVTVFRSMYMYQAGWQGRQWMLKPGTHGPIHDQLAPMCIRLDAETCLDMPELSTHRVDCELPPSVRGKYKQLKRELLAQLDSGTIFAQNAASAYMKMRQFANGRMFDEEKAVHFVHKEKQEALKEVVGELGGKPVMVFYQFKHDADAIREKFPKCPLLNGATKPNAAEKMVNDWNAGKTHVFGIQNQAASHGLNMQGAGNDVVYYGMGDRPEDYIQSFRRLYRQGVKGREVRIHRILTRGTVDDIIEGRIDGKGTTQREFCNRLRDHARTS
jgi:SNF2 family DNA or RNA helicase